MIKKISTKEISVQHHLGSASLLISSFQTVMGSIGIMIVSFYFGNRVQVVDEINTIIGLLCVV